MVWQSYRSSSLFVSRQGLCTLTFPQRSMASFSQCRLHIMCYGLRDSGSSCSSKDFQRRANGLLISAESVIIPLSPLHVPGFHQGMLSNAFTGHWLKKSKSLKFLPGSKLWNFLYVQCRQCSWHITSFCAFGWPLCLSAAKKTQWNRTNHTIATGFDHTVLKIFYSQCLFFMYLAGYKSSIPVHSVRLAMLVVNLCRRLVSDLWDGGGSNWKAS